MGPVKIFRAVFDFLVFHDRSGIVSLFEAGSIYYQRFDRAAGLSVALERAVQAEGDVSILGSSAHHRYDLSCAVVNAHRRALHLILAVVRGIFKFRELIVYTGLQFILHIHIESRIDLIAAFVKLGEAGIIEVVVYFLIRFPLLVARKVIAECELGVLDLHENFRRTLIGIGKNIRVLIEVGSGVAGQIQNDLLIDRLIVILLRDHAVLQHILQDQVPSLDRMLGIDQRIVIGGTVGNRAQIGHL